LNVPPYRRGTPFQYFASFRQLADHKILERCLMNGGHFSLPHLQNKKREGDKTFPLSLTIM